MSEERLVAYHAQDAPTRWVHAQPRQCVVAGYLLYATMYPVKRYPGQWIENIDFCSICDGVINWADRVEV